MPNPTPRVFYIVMVMVLSRSNDWGDNLFHTCGPRSYPSRHLAPGHGLGRLERLRYVDPYFFGGVAKGYNSPFSSTRGPPSTLVWAMVWSALSTVLALQPHVPYGAFAGMASGVYRTDTMDNNGNWRPKNKGLTNAVVTCLAVAPDPQHTIYAGTQGGGIFKSTDRGTSWQAINQGLALTDAQKSNGITLQINALAVEWPNYFKVYAATNIGLFRSVDGGAHWLPTTFTDGADSVITDPLVPGTVYAVRGNDWASFLVLLAQCRCRPDLGPIWRQYSRRTNPGQRSHLVPHLFGVGSAACKRLNGVGQNWEDIFGARQLSGRRPPGSLLPCMWAPVTWSLQEY